MELFQKRMQSLKFRKWVFFAAHAVCISTACLLCCVHLCLKSLESCYRFMFFIYIIYEICKVKCLFLFVFTQFHHIDQIILTGVLYMIKPNWYNWCNSWLVLFKMYDMFIEHKEGMHVGWGLAISYSMQRHIIKYMNKHENNIRLTSNFLAAFKL